MSLSCRRRWRWGDHTESSGLCRTSVTVYVSHLCFIEPRCRTASFFVLFCFFLWFLSPMTQRLVPGCCCSGCLQWLDGEHISHSSTTRLLLTPPFHPCSEKKTDSLAKVVEGEVQGWLTGENRRGWFAHLALINKLCHSLCEAERGPYCTPAQSGETYVPLFIARRSAERPRGCLKKVLFENPRISGWARRIFRCKKRPISQHVTLVKRTLRLLWKMNYGRPEKRI